LPNVLMVSVADADAGFGVNVTVEPEGCPVRLSVTAPVNPFDEALSSQHQAITPDHP